MRGARGPATQAARKKDRSGIEADILQSLEHAVIATDLKGSITYWNRGAELLYGWKSEEVEGNSVLDVTPTSASRDEAAQILGALVKGESWSGEFMVRHKDGRWFPAYVVTSPIRNEDGNLVGVIGVSRALPAEKAKVAQATIQGADGADRLMEQLKASEERYRTIGEAIPFGVWICDAGGQLTYCSPAILDLLGMTLEQVAGAKWYDTLHPEDAAATAAAWNECIRTGGDWVRLHRYRGRDGTYHPVLARGRAIRDGAGQIREWVGVNFDVRELFAAQEALQAAQERQSILVREADHRIRNSLQLVVSLLTIKANRSQGEVRSTLLSAINRVSAIAEVHAQLYRFPGVAHMSMRSYLGTLCENLTRSGVIDPELCSISLSVEDILLDADTAIPLALIANELLTNAAKHGFRPGHICRVDVSLQQSDAGIELAVFNTGPEPEPGDREIAKDGVGTKLIDALSSRIRGTFTRVRSRHGTMARLRIAVSARPAR